MASLLLDQDYDSDGRRIFKTYEVSQNGSVFEDQHVIWNDGIPATLRYTYIGELLPDDDNGILGGIFSKVLLKDGSVEHFITRTVLKQKWS